jgi:hypothetical protein
MAHRRYEPTALAATLGSLCQSIRGRRARPRRACSARRRRSARCPGRCRRPPPPRCGPRQGRRRRRAGFPAAFRATIPMPAVPPGQRWRRGRGAPSLGPGGAPGVRRAPLSSARPRGGGRWGRAAARRSARSPLGAAPPLMWEAVPLLSLSRTAAAGNTHCLT